MPEGTITFSDLYGGKRPSGEPNIIERDSAAASGEFTPLDMARPAIYWVALVGMVILFRFILKEGKSG
jgi:hypothetical protein